ncbi:MAG: hypothetical protein U0934_04765 [Pseudotabrizicola sp.]|uniref:hypothetical protein n=1 Tax=Pseudotabrizicola sp. TaxID=2939647 RepID=UPI0027314B72|nr:hypothetical protein [Pseudotabrizicola sp.]MDP2082212.1 hypothetical protein [Pseudotabrizicola sp.]MDZ7573251.1 hypothetical protein [Pseudotabrizicola sp.]
MFELRAAVRGILLPVASAREAEFLAEVTRLLEIAGVTDDKASWISLQLRRWQRDGAPTPAFRAFVRDLLFLADRDPKTFIFDSLEGPNGAAYQNASRLASANFFDLHAALVSAHLLDHDSARQILSHSGMIARLAVEEKMTASEISRLIAVRDNRFSLNWRAVQAILTKFGCAPTLSLPASNEVFEDDMSAEPALFGDLDIEGGIERVAEVAKSLGCAGDFSAWLSDLFINDLHHPYLLLLHYQLLIQARFDHAVTYAYEFKPRGQIADWLTEKYISSGIPVAKNAFLNNAKATLRFDQVWVTGRTDSPRSATALANILETIENLGSLAKDELAAQIRGLLHRYIRVESEKNNGDIPHRIPVLNVAQATTLLNATGNGNTGTNGILEQRLLDCYGLMHHTVANGWTPKGLRDSVFAANTFRKKFGDVEFERPVRPNPEVVAYESHGGRLTLPYVLDHLDSFASVLALREEELTSIAPLADWRFEVVFVAHVFDAALPPVRVVRGVNVAVRYITFAAAALELAAANATASVNSHIVDALNNGFIHPQVRQRALGMIAP